MMKKYFKPLNMWVYPYWYKELSKMTSKEIQETKDAQKEIKWELNKEREQNNILNFNNNK